MEVKVLDINGKETGRKVQLSDSVFAIEPNKHAVYLDVKQYLANQRQGTQSAKTRGEVRGGGRKPWRQKGTGRARQGSIRSPQWIGGGVVFAPKPRDYSYKLPKKIKRLALKSALSSKVRDNEIIVVDSLVLDKPKTKDMVKILSNLKAGKKTLVVMPERDENVILASRNIPGVKTAYVNTINVYDIVRHNKFIVTREAVSKIEEVYA